MSDYSTFLFARPSFLEGMGRIADVFGAFDRYDESPSGEEADSRAFWADWCAIGEDFKAALKVQRVSTASAVETKPR